MATKAWSVGKLLTGWAGYWAVLSAATLAKPIALIAKLANQPENTSSASFNFSNTAINASMQSYGKELWSLHTSVLALTLWIAGPPLIIWAVWLWRNAVAARQDKAARNTLGTSAPQELRAGDEIGDLIGRERAQSADRVASDARRQSTSATSRE